MDTSSEITGISTVKFDEDSGLFVTDLGSGAVKVSAGDFFRTISVADQAELTAQGLGTLRIIAENGIVLATDPTGDSTEKTLTISSNPKTVEMFQDGRLEVRAGTVRWYSPGNITVSKIVSRLATTADTAIIAVIKKNGTAVETVTIPIGQSKVTDTVDFSMSEDDYLTVDITQVGSIGESTQGSGLSVIFTYIYT